MNDNSSKIIADLLTQIQSITERLSKLERHLTPFAPGELQQTLEEHEDRLDNHEARFDMFNNRFESVQAELAALKETFNRNINTMRSDIDRLMDKVTVTSLSTERIERSTEKTNKLLGELLSKYEK